MQILARLKRFLQQSLPEKNNTGLMVGVSGGPDSMVLLWALNQLAPELSFQLFPVHLNYRLHDRADQASELVRSWSDEHGLHCVSSAVVEPDKLQEESGSLEANARELRYDFFQSTGRSLGTNKLFLAHHRADQIETVLLNIGRGSGLFGLQGMTAHSQRRGLKIYRPFLEVPQERLRAVARDRDLPFVEDPTNKSLKMARNRLRHEVLPAWEEAQPDPARALHKLSCRARRENEFWENYLNENFQFWQWPGEIQVEVEPFNRAKPVAQMRLLHYLFRSLADRQLLSEQNLEDFKALFEADKSGKVIHLPKGFRARREYDRVALYRVATEREELTGRITGIPWADHWPDTGEIRVLEPPVKGPQGLSSQVEKRAVTESRLRRWESGDRLEYRGRPRKVKEIFQSNRVPYRARRSWPILVRDNEPLALPGLAVKDGFSGEDGVIINFLPEHPKFAQLSEVSYSLST